MIMCVDLLINWTVLRRREGKGSTFIDVHKLSS